MYLISACLCGVNCKYNGGNNYNEKIYNILKSGMGIIICPEQLGGMTTPRKPCEIRSEIDELGFNKVTIINVQDEEKTENFYKGAGEVLRLAKDLGIKKAILKDGSPSCGVNFIYDGTFKGNKIKGSGITADLLKKNGIDVISENEFK